MGIERLIDEIGVEKKNDMECLEIIDINVEKKIEKE